MDKTDFFSLNLITFCGVDDVRGLFSQNLVPKLQPDQTRYASWDAKSHGLFARDKKKAHWKHKANTPIPPNTSLLCS